jgi:glycosyltransferase involved in cell wall biosynthesis
MISIIIPAHNEESSIGRCLTRLLEAGPDLDPEIIVVCNGCKDQTANVARQYGDRIRVIETDVASKVHALNLGDEAAKGFPRFYMDADVVLTPEDLRQVAQVLTTGGKLAAAPRMEMDFSKASWAVRAFYRVWMELPYTKKGMMGVGVYALSREGRERFDKFPDIIADDGYIRVLYKPEERMAVANAKSVVVAPATLDGLIKIKTRSRLGGYQLAQRYPQLNENDDKDYGSAAGGLLLKPALWPCIPVYLYVNLLAKRRARKQLATIANYVWERDESSRQA